jgi:hypothetical protein
MALATFTKPATSAINHKYSSMMASSNKIRPATEFLSLSSSTHMASHTIVKLGSLAADSVKLPEPEATPNVDIAAPDTDPDAPASSSTAADKMQEASPSSGLPQPPEPPAEPQSDTTQPFLVPSLNRPTREAPFYNLSASVFRNEARAYGTPEIRNLARKYLLSNPGNTALPINRDVYQNCCLLLGDYENFGALPGKVLEKLVINLCYRMNKMQKAEDIFLAMKILDEETLVHRKSKLGSPATKVLETMKNFAANAARTTGSAKITGGGIVRESCGVKSFRSCGNFERD